MRSADPKDHDARSMEAKGRHRSGSAAGERRRTVIRAGLDRSSIAAAELTPEKVLGGSVFFDFEPSPKRRLLHFSGPLTAGGTLLSKHVEVDVKRDDRIRLVGPNGAGKSTLLKVLLEHASLPPEKVLHLPQELTREEGTRLLSSLGRLSSERRGRVLAVVAALGVDPDHLLLSGRPSPGEARKLAISLGLGVGAWVLLLDEPTNHLDLPAVERIEQALEAYPGALLCVTHDDTFGIRTTSTTWRLEAGRLSVGP
jgi:ATPase subunit of ABC transporter with duplicated ATPase domains